MAAANFNREHKLKAAMDWLAAQLADGQEHLAGGLIIQAAEAGIAERTLQRASKLLKVQQTAAYGPMGSGGKRGVEGWIWQLTPKAAPGAPAKQYRRKKAAPVH